MNFLFLFGKIFLNFFFIGQQGKIIVNPEGVKEGSLEITTTVFNYAY